MNAGKTVKSITLLILLLAVLLPAAALAQGNDPTDDEVNAIAKQLFCPVCENIPLDTCGTAACEQWRGIIRDKLAEGWTEDQIKAYFVQQYGDRVLAEPPAQGFNWIVYIVPLVIFLGGGFLFFTGFQKWRQQAAAPERERTSPKPAGSTPAADEYISRVEDELRKRSKE